MFFPWYTTALLAAESSTVIGLRLAKIALGGPGALDEAQLMINEKIGATWEAGATLLGGGDVFAVVDRFREHVGANAGRLAVG